MTFQAKPMDIQTFYAFTAGICFTLVGLWWNVVQSKKEWLKDEAMRELASGVYLSFLIPGLMSMVAQVGIDSPLLWRLSFVIASGLGIFYTNRISAKTRNALPNGKFHSNRWGVNLLYGLILAFALLPDVSGLIGLKPLTIEGLLIIGLLLIGHGLTWEFLVENST
jgi:hypothetical protein